MSASKITNQNHLTLLQHLGNFGVPPAKPRTDCIASHLGWSNNHMPSVGLELRANGWVQSTNDGKQYNYWQITPAGRARLLEHRAAEREARQPKVTVPVEKTKPFLGWRVIDTFDGDLSPIIQKKSEADALAEKWAKDEPGRTMQVVGIVSTVKASVVIDKE